MLAASQRKFDVLLFWALDRLSREGIVKTLGYLEQLRTWGCGWRSYTQPCLDTGNEMTNGIVLSVLAAVAKQEASLCLKEPWRDCNVHVVQASASGAGLYRSM